MAAKPGTVGINALALIRPRARGSFSQTGCSSGGISLSTEREIFPGHRVALFSKYAIMKGIH